MSIDTATASLSDARRHLADLLDAIDQARAEADEVSAQWRRLGYIKQAEASARMKLDAIKARDAAELAEQLVNPTGMHEVAAHQELGEAQWELDRATREADVARACEADVSERATGAGRRIEELKSRVPERTAAVMVEEAAGLAREIDTDAARLRAKYARLWGLTSFLRDAQLFRVIERVPAAIHPDNVCPTQVEVGRASRTWNEFAGLLVEDQSAQLDEVE